MVVPPTAAAPPGSSSVPLPSDERPCGLLFPPCGFGLLLRRRLFRLRSAPLHSVLSAALSSVPLPPARYFPPTPLSFLRTVSSSVVHLLLTATVDVPTVATVISSSSLSVPRVVPYLTLYLSSAPLPQPLPPLGLLIPHVLPLAPPLPTSAANIARKDKYVGNQTGRGETGWPNAGGALPRRKCRIRPLVILGDSIRRPLFLHCPHQ